MSSDLRFAVLGPVRAWRGNAELGVGAPQQQAVLAMLLLAKGRQVALDAVISGRWDDDPPLAATGTVRTYVSRLRRRLGSARVAAGAGCMRSAIPLSRWKPVFIRLTGRATFGVWALMGWS
jgi:DNA-binding SARP family transcriptional activator